MSSAATIARALGGHRNGAGFLCRCPVSSHGKGEGDRHPSLSVGNGDKALLVRCFAGCDPRDVLDELRRRGLIEDAKDAPRRERRSPRPPPTVEPEPDAEALALWHEAEPIEGTLGERYLREHRRLGIAIPPSLRFLPEAAYARTGHTFPAIVAGVQRPDRTLVAVQVTFLRPRDGAKAPVAAPRLTIGRLGTGAIRLGPAGAVLGLAEGAETALSAMELSGVPCWAALGGQRLSKITVPATVREIHLFGDDDAAGRLSAELAAGRYSRDGLRVLLRWPPEGFPDWNDYLRSQTARAA